MKEIILKELQKNPYITIMELSKILNISEYKARKLRKLYSNLSVSDYIAHRNIVYCTAKPINIGYNANQIILGSLLGDGSIVKKSNCVLSITHSAVQEGYCSYKNDLLNSNGIISNLRYRKIDYKNKSIIDGRIIKDNGKVCIQTQQNQSFNKYRNDWYSDKKIIPKSVYELGSLGLAIWFMDDGSKNKSSYYLNTNCFSMDEQLILVDMLFKNFGIIAKIHKNKDKFILYITAKSRELFTKIIYPYICDSMKYKLYEKVIGDLKQGELLETPTTNNLVNEDNQQPSLDSNIPEGSETNNRVQLDNSKDSNVDTSALPIILSNFSFIDGKLVKIY